MKESVIIIDSEICEVNCNLQDAELTVCPTEDENLCVIYPEANNVSVASGKGVLIVNQAKRPILCGKQRIKVCVPQHLLPSVNLNCKKSKVSIINGIFAELVLRAESGLISLTGTSFAQAEVEGGDLDVYLNGVTVKGNLSIKCEKGDVIAENAFATRTEIRVGKGNAGLINFNSYECVIDTAKGNITATFAGVKDEYTLFIKTSGTSNTDSILQEGATRTVRANANGNVMLDFIGKSEKVAEVAAEDGSDSQKDECSLV